MKHLVDIVNESVTVPPLVEDDKVKVIALVSNDYVDDNLNLMKGMNKVCLIWAPKDGKGYMCADGGVRWNDGKQWDDLRDLEKYLGVVKWEKADSIHPTYSYAATIGKPKEYNIEVYYAEIPAEDLEKIYKQNGKSLWINKRGCATAYMSQVFKAWKSGGML